MIDIRDFPDLPSGTQQILDQFLANENQSQSHDQLATSVWKLILQIWRDMHQLPTDEEHPEIDRQLTQLIEQWDSDDPSLAIVEKLIKRLAEDRGPDALDYLERSIKNKSEEFSKLQSEEFLKLQSTRAKGRRQRDCLSPLIEDFVKKHPNGSAVQLLAYLKKYERADGPYAVEDDEIYVDGRKEGVPISGLKDRLYRAKKVESR